MSVRKFEAKKSGLRQSKDGVVISLVIHPSDVSQEILSDPIGQVYMVACAPVDDEPQQPANPSPFDENPFPPDKTLGERALARAAMLIRNDRFQAYSESETFDFEDMKPEERADRFLKERLEIQSKSELLTSDGARSRLDTLADEFLKWERETYG